MKRKGFAVVELGRTITGLVSGFRLIAIALVVRAFVSSVVGAESVTYSREVAPILFGNCVTCHRSGQSAPFPLLNYADAKKHAKDIARVTAQRIMPPWLPEHGVVALKGERRLTEAQIATIQSWVANNTPEGNSADAPKPPSFSDDWQLGRPDLVLQPSEAYVLPAAGKDIYFNFVVPVALTENKFVSGFELLPASPAVHHAFITFDSTPNSRRKGATSQPSGFFGMSLPETADMPDGQLLGWQPGKIPAIASGGLFWTLRTNSDLVLQTHLNPQGKAVNVQPRLGLYFTNTPPTATAYRLRLTTLLLDIPAGDSNYVAETSYTLPVDLSFVRVGAHAHYLCKRMEAYATLPSGEKKWLLLINDWDFKWQGDYAYEAPIELPKQSKIVMRFTYDNSSNNPRNPFNPPRRTVWGSDSTDEMGELYFQTLPRDATELQTLAANFDHYTALTTVDYDEFLLKRNATNIDARIQLGRALTRLGRFQQAILHFEEAIRLNPTNDLPHYDLGFVYSQQGRAARALAEFKEVVRLNPNDAQAYEKLGILCAQTGRTKEARQYFQQTLRIDPQNAAAIRYMQRLDAKP